jgi:hypothetical protein
MQTKSRIIGIDTGSEQSGFVVYNPQTNSLCDKYKMENNMLLDHLGMFGVDQHILAIEMVACYGMPVGKNIFDTALWIGRTVQHWVSMKGKFCLVYRMQYKMHFTGNSRAKDSNIRQALIDRFGDKGTKEAQGFFYGISADMWSASAIALFTYDKMIAGDYRLKNNNLYELELICEKAPKKKEKKNKPLFEALDILEKKGGEK